jgi:hypothetical protein
MTAGGVVKGGIGEVIAWLISWSTIVPHEPRPM